LASKTEEVIFNAIRAVIFVIILVVFLISTLVFVDGVSFLILDPVPPTHDEIMETCREEALQKDLSPEEQEVDADQCWDSYVRVVGGAGGFSLIMTVVGFPFSLFSGIWLYRRIREMFSKKVDESV